MKILYLAPRYHTNQTAIMRGWKNHGDEIKFISYYAAPIEDYSDLKPVVLGFAPWYTAFYHFYVDILCRKKRTALDNKMKYGYPPSGRLREEIINFNPDLVILRERTVYSMKAYDICRKHEIPCILYNQNPLHEECSQDDLRHRYVYSHSPKIRMTPVLGSILQNTESTFCEDDSKKDFDIRKDGDSYYVPFAVEPQLAPDKRSYFDGDRINILCIGKYEPRKHHMMLMDAVSRIVDETGIKMHLTVIGEATGRFQKEFYKTVEEYYHQKHYEELVTLRTNVGREEMSQIYSKTDVFVIPSTLEMASVSQLEAMSYSIPVICSDTNGTSCYVEDGRDGYIFKDCDARDLYEKLKKMTDSRENIENMGGHAYEDVMDKYTFSNYYDNIMKIITDNFSS